MRRALRGLGGLLETVGARALAIMVSIVTLMLSARWLGPAGRGAIATVTTWATILSTLAALSLGQICVHQARHAPDRQWMGPATAVLVAYTLGASLACWAGLAGLFFLSDGSTIAHLPGATLTIGFAIIPFLILEQYTSALITIADRLRWYNVAQIAGKVATLLLAVAMLVVFRRGVAGFLIAMLAGQAITTGATFARLLMDIGRLPKPPLALFQQMVVNGLKLHLNVVGVLLITGMDVLMLQYFRGLAETGTFQLASQIFLMTLIVPQSAVLILNGRVGVLDPARFWAEQRRMIYIVITIMTLGALALALLAPIVVRLFASASFDASVPVLQILALAIPGATFNTMMGTQWLVRGWLFPASVITLGAGVLNCVLNLSLIPRYGGVGAAWATVGGIYIIPIVTNLYLFLRSQREFRGPGGGA